MPGRLPSSLGMGVARRGLVLLLLAGCAAPPEDPEPRIDALIEALGDDDVGVRDRATAALRLLLPGAAPALARCVENGDSEVAARCRALLHVPPDDWTWYRTSGLSGIDLQIVTTIGDLLSGCGNAKLEARIFIPKLESLRLHPASCLPLMRFTDEACADHGLPLFRITADAGCHEKVAAGLDRLGQPRSGTMIDALNSVARNTGTDFTLSREGDLRFRPRKAVFDCWWDKYQHDLYRPEPSGLFEPRSPEQVQAAWHEARQAPVKPWTLPP